MLTFDAGTVLNFDYVNYRGEQGFRHVMVLGVQYGHNEWYPEDQWFLRCWDFDKGAVRSFALNRINAEEVLVLENDLEFLVKILARIEAQALTK